MKASVQRSLPPMEVPVADSRVSRSETRRPETGLARELPAISLEMAKATIGSCLREAIDVTGANTKEFGDTAQVARVCMGQIPEPLARVWMTEDRRRAFIVSLARASGCFKVITTLTTEDENRTA